MEKPQDEVIKDLHIVWNNFVKEVDEEKKKHWASLFLFTRRNIEHCDLDNQTKCLLSTVPAQISSYLLQLVYDIVCLHTSNSDANDELSTNSKGNINKTLFSSFIQSNVITSSKDITAIITLREFLTQGLGKNILEFLLICDIKHISCKGELINLLLKLFPNSKWDNEKLARKFQLEDRITIDQFLNGFNLLTYNSPNNKPLRQSTKTTRHHSNAPIANTTSHSNISTATAPKPSDEINVSNEKFFITNYYSDNNIIEDITYNISKFKEFTETNYKSSDEIASILISILIKVVKEESGPNSDIRTITHPCLKFALDNLNSITDINNQIFEEEPNREIIKNELLLLIVQCLNNIFIKKDLLIEVSDLTYVLKALILITSDIITNNSDGSNSGISDLNFKSTFFINYLIFAIINNILVHFKNNNDKLTEIYIFFDNGLFIQITKNLNTILNNFKGKSLFQNITIIIIKIINFLKLFINRLLIRKFDNRKNKIITTIATTTTTTRNGNDTSLLNCNEQEKQPHHNEQKHEEYDKEQEEQHHHHHGICNLSCFLEKLLIDIYENLILDDKKMIIKQFQNNSLCCCYCNIDTYKIFILDNCCNNNQVQKLCYRLLKKILKKLYNRNECSICTKKSKLTIFQKALFKLYKMKYEQIDKMCDLVSYLNHLIKISIFLDFDLSSDILVNIVLPQFRKEKLLRYHSTESITLTTSTSPTTKTIANHTNNNNNNNNNKQVILCCLNIFINYLTDLRLIKAYFIEENIEHLTDLIFQPELANAACTLIKIGIYNSSYLGENNIEMLALTEKLYEIQIITSIYSVQYLKNLYKQLNINNIKSCYYDNIDISTSIEKEYSINRTMKKLTIKQNLLLSSIYWKFMLRLYKTEINGFRKEFHKIYHISSNISPLSSSSEQKSFNNEEFAATAEKEEGNNRNKQEKYFLSSLIYQTLSLFLYRPPPPPPPPPSPQPRTEHQQIYQIDEKENNDIVMCTSRDSSLYYLNCLQQSFQQQQPLHGVFINTSDTTSNTTSLISSDFCFISNDELISSDNNYLNDNDDSQYFDRKKFAINSNYPETNSFSQIIETSSLNDLSIQDTFLDKLTSCESSLIFDIRLQKPTISSATTVTSRNREILKIFQSTHHDDDVITNNTKSQSSQQLFVNSVQRLNNLLTTSVFGFLFRNEINYSNNDNYSEELREEKNNFDKNNVISIKAIDPDLIEECTSDFCKKLLLQIFEYTMSTFVSAVTEASKMQSMLLELKSILLAHTVHNLECDDEANAIIQVLQSLLKVAEMTNRSTNIECNYSKVSHLHKEPDENSEINLSRVSDADFYSANLSYDQIESEAEPSETETEEFYMTAEEDYDADAETQEISNSDQETEKMSCPPPTSRFRTNISNTEIYKVVLEVLIELSKKCIENPSIWVVHLTQLSNRLYVIREHLGGPLFLLKGFAPILQCGDNKLKDFQKSILDLIPKIDKPEALSAYLNILATFNPPVDILVPYLSHICLTSLRIQPTADVVFPTNNDGSITCSCNPILFEQIKQIHNYHDYHNLRSPFTQSTYIVPFEFVNFKPWSQNGFTISTWIQAIDVKSGYSLLSDSEPNGKQTSTEDCKSHLLSIGSSQLMLSVYINNYMHLVFETNQPKAEITSSKSGHDIKQSKNPPTDTPEVKTKNENCRPKICILRRKRKVGLKDLTRIAPNKENLTDNQKISNKNLSDRSSLINAIENTKLALRNSFNQFQIFGGNDNTENSAEKSHVIELKYIRLMKSKWTHLCFAVECKNNGLYIKVIVDGSESYTVTISIEGSGNLTKTEKLEMLCIGQKLNNSSTAENSNGGNNYEQHIKYSMSTLMIFRKCISEKKILANLTALGPDCNTLVNCQVGNLIPNYGFLSNNKINKFEPDNFGESLKLLERNLVGIYSAHEPNVLIGFENFEEVENSGNNGVGQLGMATFGEGGSCRYIPSVQTATFFSGGLSCLLYLFARTVELTSDSKVQACALELLLNVAHSNSYLYTEFIKKDFLSLIGSVIRTDQCAKDQNILKVMLNAACKAPLISTRNDNFYILDNTNACIIYPNLIVYIIQRYSDWNNSLRDSDVLDILMLCIQKLLREKHPYQNINLAQLTKAGFIKALFNFCKIYIVESPNPVFISKESAKAFVSILSIIAGAPPSASYLDEIIKLLLLLQRPSECFVTHDRSKFYFLINSDPPIKHKKMSLPLPSKQMRQSLRDRKRTAPARLNSMLFDSKSPARRTNSDENSFNLNQTQKPSNNGNIEIEKIEEEATFIKFDENLDSLESIADCSRMSKKTINFFDPIEATKLHKLLYNLKRKQQQQQYENKNRAKKIVRRRFRAYSQSLTDSDSENKRRSFKSTSENGIDLDSFTAREYDIVNSDEVSLFAESDCQRKARRLVKLEFYNSPGFVKIQEGLFILLKDFLLILPDSSVNEVVTHYVKIDILLVLSNHHNPDVRAAIIRLLTVLCERLPSSELQAVSKHFYWHHLGNQLALHPANENLILALIQWATGTFINFDQLETLNDVKISKTFALNSLIAILPQTLCDSNLAVTSLKLIETIYKNNINLNNYMIDNGLIPILGKTVFIFYSNPKPVNEAIEDSLKSLLYVVALRSLKSAGHINILWELINTLAYNQNSQLVGLSRGIRLIIAYLLHTLIQEFFSNERNPTLTSHIKFRASDLRLPNSTLSSTEIKTRFDLLIDKGTQFFIATLASHKLSSLEITFFERLTFLAMNGNARCNHLIAWGLSLDRPQETNVFMIKCLWRLCTTDSLPSIICDAKIVRTLLWSCLTINGINLSGDELAILTKLCKHLGIENVSPTSVRNALDKLESDRENCIKELNPAIEKILHKYESTAQSCIEHSMIITRVVAELQNSERKLLISQMRQYDESFVYREWPIIVQRMTHEAAPWYCEKDYPKSWELDDTEGPSRVRVRLRRCHLDIDPKFKIQDSTENLNCISLLKEQPLQYLTSKHDQRLHFSLNSQVLHNFSAKYLPVDGEIDGELIVTENQLIFVATHRCKFYYVSCDINKISEIWLRRYQHQENGFEIFVESNKSMFFALYNVSDIKTLKEMFADKIFQNPDQSKLLVLTQQWREGQLTNWEYLMTLNQMSGRTYNDLMQYPVFPWILADYESQYLNLTSIRSFRKLEKPIAVQHEDNEVHYVNNYNYIDQSMSVAGSMHMKPYHYSSHYSNSGTVLHFLVRIPPFTMFFLRYQDNNFDLPDRTFHSMKTTWCLASKDSPTDVKELVPEFFCLPEMFENFESFNFGTRQSGEPVNHVSLPPWCSNSFRTFVLIHRQALESEIVRKNLHHWIDLIFGYKQTGTHAVEAINVFHPATYSTFSASNISDPIEKKALETMIKTYGQMPRQLFKTPHPQSSDLNYPPNQPSVVTSVKGLRWGVFTGSPQLPDPKVCNIYKQAGTMFSSLVSFGNTNAVYAIPDHCNVMQGSEPDVYNLISWKNDDGIVRTKPLNECDGRSRPLTVSPKFDEICVCGSDTNASSLWFGHKSGRITVYQCSNIGSNKYNKNRQTFSGIKLSYNSAFRKVSAKSLTKLEEFDSENGNNNDNGTWSEAIVLLRHTDEITVITLSTEFKIAVSGGRDGLAVIWDLNSLNYVRTIERPSEINHSPINIIAISPTLGDILSVHSIKRPRYNDNENNQTQSEECFEVTEESVDDFVNVAMNLNGKSLMRLHSVNAKYVNHYVLEDKILAACYSYIKEGVGVNVIATGFEGGIIRLWSSWDLSLIKEIEAFKSDIISLTYSTYQHLVVLTKDNYIQVWESDGLYGNAPKFPQIMFQRSSSS